MLDLRCYFYLFIIYSFLGWILEVLWTFFHDKKLVNRGFLIGPYCPIYGVGCIFLIVFLDVFKDNIFLLFFMSIIICSFLEYFASFAMEKLFNAHWWDYSHYKFNLNGRICIETMIPFGLLGVLVVKFLNPFLVSNIDASGVFFYIISFIFIIDIAVSSFIIDSMKNTINNFDLDNTEEISSRVKEVLVSKSPFHKRLVNAFPFFKSKLIKIKDFVIK